MPTPAHNPAHPTDVSSSTPALWIRACPLWARLILTAIAGGLTPLALAPLSWWPLAILTPSCLALLCWNQPLKTLYKLCYGFGLGLFGVGASWVYVSIHEFGYAASWLAALLTALFVAFLALMFALPFGLLRWRPTRLRGKVTSTQPATSAEQSSETLGAFLLCFCALWVLGEWTRSWLLTGFPWLFIGYSQGLTPLSGWAPIGGIYSLSLAVLISSCGWIYLLLGNSKAGKLLTAFAIATLWIGGQALRPIQWTQPAQETPVSVSLIQANIPQEKKWQPNFLQPTLERYSRLSESAWQSDWVIWPEAAIPLLYHRAGPFLEQANNKALQTNTALITGILYDDQQKEKFFNSATGLGLASGIYHKTRLVPFGEYVPMENWLRGLIQFFNLPTSIISQGPDQQSGLQIGSHRLATAICYEIVYPDLVSDSAQNREVILTISNDAWFGSSWGPLQHLEMAQMRALETGRYVIRATNNGVSALITPKGELQQRSEQFVEEVVTGPVIPMTGDTPFMRWGSLPVLILCFGLLTFGLWQTQRSIRRPIQTSK